MPSNNIVAGHVIAAVLALLQCGLTTVLAYRMYVMSQVKGGADHRRRATTVYMLRVHRTCIFIMTFLQCIRCFDPFGSLGIWPYSMLRFLQLSITITIYFQYSATTYVVMDTLYACVLKRTPSWLACVVSILPVSEFFVGFSMLAAEYAIRQQWVNAVICFFTVLMFIVNLLTYNISGMLLIRILRNHQNGAPAASGEDISGSKSASPFDVVISKTTRSLILLSLPSLAALMLFFVLGVSNLNTKPVVPYDPNAPPWGAPVVLFVQIILGLLFTRVTWISKTLLDAEVVGKAVTGTSTHSSERRSTKTTSRTDKTAVKMSQSPKQSSRPSEDLQTDVAVAIQLPSESCATAAVAVDVENTNSPNQ